MAGKHPGQTTGKYLLLAGAGILVTLLLWLAGRVLLDAMYHGNAGEYLNSIITGQSVHPLEKYLADFDRLCIYLAAAISLPLLTYSMLPAGLVSSIRQAMPVLMFILSVAIFAFSYGYIVALKKLPPHSLIKTARKTLEFETPAERFDACVASTS